MKKLEDLEEELRISAIREERISALLEIANHERLYLRDQVKQFETQRQELSKQIMRCNEVREETIFNKDEKIKALQNKFKDLEIRNKNMGEQIANLQTVVNKAAFDFEKEFGFSVWNEAVNNQTGCRDTNIDGGENAKPKICW